MHGQNHIKFVQKKEESTKGETIHNTIQNKKET